MFFFIRFKSGLILKINKKILGDLFIYFFEENIGNFFFFEENIGRFNSFGQFGYLLIKWDLFYGSICDGYQ